MATKIRENVELVYRSDFGSEDEVSKNILKLVSNENYFKSDIVNDDIIIYNNNSILISKKDTPIVTELKINVNKILNKENCYISKLRKIGNNVKVMIVSPWKDVLLEKYKSVGYNEFVKALNFGTVPGMLTTYIDITEFITESEKFIKSINNSNNIAV